MRTVVDTGAGAGALLACFKPHLPRSRWTAIEIWAPYVETFRLRQRYDKVITGDVRALDPLPPADLYLFGDVLEHMHAGEAVDVWNRARQVARWLVIGLPVKRYEQGEVNGNPHEAHLVHWTTPGVLASFPGIVAHCDRRPDLPPYYEDSVSGAFFAEGQGTER